MQQGRSSIPDVRPLTGEERLLIQFMLEHPHSHFGHNFLPQVDHTSVVSRCPCGCASIDLAVDDVVPERRTGMNVLGNFEWRGSNDEYMGAFVFAAQSY